MIKTYFFIFGCVRVFDRSLYILPFLQEILKEDAKNYAALLLIGAAYQDDNPPMAVKYLKKATECSKDPIHAYQGLLKCAPIDEIPEIAKNYLKAAP